ncbi:MAG: archaeosortase H [Promethearchaeota archaeon]
MKGGIKIRKERTREKPVIEFEGKKYVFSINSILILAIGAPVLSFLIYLFFDNVNNYWLHEIVVKQTAFFLNLFFNMGAKAHYIPGGYKYQWMFSIPGRGGIFFETFCTGIQAICVFAGIIICTPHSQDPNTNQDIIWRKAKALVVSSVIFYVVNIIRMLIQLYLYYLGYNWSDIHYSISAASSFIAAIIILLLHKWIPEFILSIIYTGTLINEPIKRRRIEVLKKSAQHLNSVDLNLIRRVLKIEKNQFSNKIHSWAEFYGYKIDGEVAKIPKESISNLIKMLDSKKPFENWLEKQENVIK